MDEDLGFDGASKMIEGLLGISSKSREAQPAKINEPRLGMVMKECYRYFRSHEKDILKEHRQRFKENVAETYQLFTEIAQELEQSKLEA